MAMVDINHRTIFAGPTVIAPDPGIVQASARRLQTPSDTDRLAIFFPDIGA
jgi:hypothetical protein